MKPQQLLEVGAKGIHLLFDLEMIEAAFGQDAPELRRTVEGRLEEVHRAVQALLAFDDPEAGRRFVGSLAPEVRHVVVLLYFELLDDRLRASRTLQ
ncbi:hypothetical protein MYXO_00727 [Myxococcaceae bacterium]|jgi:hypothetical protein|nr:hypothetical protein MYXO_00727 [Myxococcaceae bacterium]